MSGTMTTRWRSVLFVDLDHTVMRGPFCKAVFEDACGEIARKSGRPVDQVRDMVKQENLRRQQSTDTDAVYAMDWDDIVQQVAKELDVELETSIVELVESSAESGSHLIDGADRILGELVSDDRAVVAATNGLAKYQLPVLRALGLDKLFDEVLTPDETRVLKNSRAFYGQWPVNSELQTIVGDDLEWDIDAPQRLGFKAILKNGKQSHDATPEPFYAVSASIQPDAVIDSLDELPQTVGRLEDEVLSDPKRKRKGWWNVPRKQPESSRSHSVQRSLPARTGTQK